MLRGPRKAGNFFSPIRAASLQYHEKCVEFPGVTSARILCIRPPNGFETQLFRHAGGSGRLLAALDGGLLHGGERELGS